jgi:restriction system protein
MSYKQVWQIEVRHDGLKKYRLVKGTDKYVVEQKASAQKAAWDEMWRKKQEVEERVLEKQLFAYNKQMKKELALEKTSVAKEAVEQLWNMLRFGLTCGEKFSWESLADTSEFTRAHPEKIPTAKPDSITIQWNEPKAQDSKYKPRLGLLGRIFPARRRRIIENAQRQFDGDHVSWELEKQRIATRNREMQEEHEEQIRKYEEEYERSRLEWEQEKDKFLEDQRANNEAIASHKKEYLEGSPEAVVEYCEMVLSSSSYPDYFPREFDLDYYPEAKMLLVDYSLPSVQDIPRLKEVKYIQSRDEFLDVPLSEAERNKTYDSLVYQIALRVTYELYTMDIAETIYAVVFNGWVKFIDKATGNEESACIVSLQTDRGEFAAINLLNVDPKECFKSLKGVGSSKIHSLTAIPPILTIDREDKRFVSSYDVADALDDRTNIAAMDWEDFEHLIREIFAKEFSQSGGEVKVTQASRDGGVDAVAFDPDPIRGGKVVIQAKRYTNVVGVSAVRDLYGTVLNEGATKGVLVTTATFGPDAYEFAKGKPLTLLDGGNLLHLLEKHGHKARINLREAKTILAERERERER